MADLVDELSADFGEGKIFRPYRDVRFSQDKSPYKTNVAADYEQRRLHPADGRRPGGR